MIQKTLHRKRNFEQHKNGRWTGTPEGYVTNILYAYIAVMWYSFRYDVIEIPISIQEVVKLEPMTIEYLLAWKGFNRWKKPQTLISYLVWHIPIVSKSMWVIYNFNFYIVEITFDSLISCLLTTQSAFIM